jgi:hypothetical protein
MKDFYNTKYLEYKNNGYCIIKNCVDKDVLARVATEIMSTPTIEEQAKK